MIYELDDDLLDVDPSNVAAYREFGRPAIRANIRANLAAADAVTVTTAPLAAVVRQHTDAPVHVVPNYLPDWLPLDLASLDAVLGDGAQSPMVIGWAGGSSHRRDVAECQNEVRRFIDRIPGTELHTIGMRWDGSTEGTQHTKWSPRVPDFYRSLDFDIGLAPLRPSVFNRSKSAVKVMEYGALGIVPVASNVGPYADYIEAGHDGLLVDQPHQWGIALRMLTGDRELRATLARNAWEKARDNAISNHVAEWAAVIEEVLYAVVQ
jgi:glycosyltransferase involved in cell wall biosynthesis